MIEDDPNIRLVYREWPILGDGSVFAAKAALAARKQDKYEEFHWAMMGLEGRAEEAVASRPRSSGQGFYQSLQHFQE